MNRQYKEGFSVRQYLLFGLITFFTGIACVALGSDTQGTHKEQNLLFVRHARG